MSIFKNKFSPFVEKQLSKRQELIHNINSSVRTSQAIQYLNSRNAWIRMTSSVNVNGSNELAEKYILQGGTLNTDKKLKSGIGGNFNNNAYSNTAADGTSYQRGIRPMPGITSMDVKSKSAYGSLREITIDFQCWDIKQLEDLEVLYMRPGYTVLIEWGWVPYFITKEDKPEEYKSRFVDYYSDNILYKENIDRTVIFKELYEKSKAYSGNYDAMFGYVRNYSWSARPDGGYDCRTIVISTGEIIESLKLNYLKPNLKKGDGNRLITVDPINLDLFNKKVLPYYQKYNILAGMWAELYYKYAEGSNPNLLFGRIIDIPALSTVNTNNSDVSLSSGDKQVYIKLKYVFQYIQDYIIAKDNNGNPLIKLSLKQNEYDEVKTLDEEGRLLCLAHPLQVSVDPSVCLIYSPLWVTGETVVAKVDEVLRNSNEYKTAKEAFDLIRGGIGKDPSNLYSNKELALDGIKKINDITTLSWVDAFIKEDNYIYDSLQDVLNDLFEIAAGPFSFKNDDYFNEKQIIVNSLEKIGVDIKVNIKSKSPFDIFTVREFVLTYNRQSVNSISIIAEQGKQAFANIKFIKDLDDSPYFYEDTYSELGIIENIYVNVNYLFKKAIDYNIEASDRKEKNDINLYPYLKRIAHDIQVSIGNVNNFEIHVDPIDNTARMIDINYTEQKAFKELFELQIHNLKSVVRSYNLQSQIFPEQSSLIAIGAQVKGGQLGIQNNTLIDFNRNIIDRIIPSKLDGSGEDNLKVENDKSSITNGLVPIIQAFEALNPSSGLPSSTPNIDGLFNSAKNSLKDLIVYFQSITNSPGSNRNIIPTKFSFEMDGIGGLVIGHMFKLPKSIFPKGYKGEEYGTELGQIITGIGHTISNGDWITKVDSLNIVLSTKTEKVSFKDLSLDDLIAVDNEEIVANIVNTVSPDISALRSNISSTQPNAITLEVNLSSQGIATVKPQQLDNNGDIDPRLPEIAFDILFAIKRRYPNLSIQVTAGNDITHKNLSYISEHTKGKGIDFKVDPFPDQSTIIGIVEILEGRKRAGDIVSYRDEYTDPSKEATGAHFHFLIS